MNNIELEKLVKKDAKLAENFIGIFSCDTLPKHISKRPCALIVNTQPSHMSGEHWVCMYFDVYNNVDYFDSFGLLPFVPEIEAFVLNNSKHQYYNLRRLQSSDSSVCGLYCLYFLYFKMRRVKVSTILDIFHFQNFAYNDRIVCKFLARVFNHLHKVCSKIK